MEIKVNDYVRDHINGIGKVIKCYDNELEIVFKKVRVKTSVSSYFEFGLNKSRPRIIDLIQVGDYVNGYYVSTIWEVGETTHYVDDKPIKRKERQITIQTPSYGGIIHLHNGDIKSVLTKEQFEQMEYKVGE